VVSKMMSLFALYRFRAVWRKQNTHNFTTAGNLFDPAKVSVGNFSYGSLNVHCWGNPDERLQIGHFVSIAGGVQILLGGGHPTDRLSTYPFQVNIFGASTEATTRGPIIIHDDVWICLNALILSGVTIGQGAVIGAGSVITRDVPPYAVITGNPARVTRYRFDPPVVERLLRIDYSRVSVGQLTEMQHLLQQPVTDSVLDKVFGVLRGMPEIG
jgi:acetyltransferase-like isoleucine patch superfamily enzyme